MDFSAIYISYGEAAVEQKADATKYIFGPRTGTSNFSIALPLANLGHEDSEGPVFGASHKLSL